LLTYPSSSTSRSSWLPLGKHTLSWTLTDSAGVQESIDQQISVAMLLTSNLPRGPRTVVAGSTIKLAPKVSSPDGFSTLKSWSFVDNMAFNDHVLASGTGATPPSLTIVTPLKKETDDLIELRLVSDSGLVTVEQFSYQTGWATAAYTHVSTTRVKRGGYVSVYASDWVRVNGTWAFDVPSRATMQYQWSIPGSGVWHNGTKVSIAGPRVVRPPAVKVKITRTVCFRSVYTQTDPLVTYMGSTLVPATSAPVCVRAY
jgi:hypothetical protein